MSEDGTEARAPPYATTNYEADEDGTLHAVLPTRCVYATGEQTCAIFVDHYRERKSGPCYPVAVVGCRKHGGRRYTLYPPGHYPYGRVAVVRYSVGGELLLEADSGQPQWQETLFGAAQDAEQEKGWLSEQNWWRTSTACRRTQGRRLELAGRLTGVSPELEDRERERIATRLGVATMTVLAGARSWERSWQSRGAAIVAVLVAVAVSATLGDRMGAAGAVSDLWGPPRPRLVARWEQAGKSWIVARAGRSEAREKEMAGSLRERAPPATKTPVRAASGGATVGA